MGLRLTGSSGSSSRFVVRVLVAVSDHLMDDAVTQGTVAQIEEHLASRGMGIERVTIEDLLNTTPKRSAVQTPALVLLGDQDSDSVVNRLTDRFVEYLSPALVIVPRDHYQTSLLLRAQGIMCETDDLDADQTAVILWTLAQRQPAIQQIATDLRLTELSVNSVHTEINKLHEELATAASIQREYMPRQIPRILGAELGIVYRPASYVSGDIYDIIELDDEHTGFFLADAVGHGVPAALMTMVITQGLRKTEGSNDNPHIIPPSEALRRLNNTMTEHAGEQARFATAVYAIHNKRTNEITIAGAGHPPSLLVRSKSGEVEHLESDGPLLGVFPDVEFGQETVTLEPGDVFIMYSDGFEVAFPHKDAVGDDRKRPTLTYLSELAEAGNGRRTLSQAIDRLESHLDSHNGSLHQPDDITALFLSNCGSSELV